MTFFSPAPSVQAQSQPIGTTLPPIQARQASDNCALEVGIAPIRQMGDAELQAHILRCAENFVAAQRRGDSMARDHWYHAECDAWVEKGCRAH